MCDPIGSSAKAGGPLSACKQSLAHGALRDALRPRGSFNAGREEGHKELKVRISETGPPIVLRSPGPFACVAAAAKPQAPSTAKP